MINTVEEAIVVAAITIGLGGLWAFAIGGMAHMAWESAVEPLREWLRARKG
jgi:hypothetical protein